MALPTKHIIHQGPVLKVLGQTAVTALRESLSRNDGKASGRDGRGVETPTPELSETLPPRPADLVRDYVRRVGGDPSAYKKHLPPHLWPQWGFPLAARTLENIPYPMFKVLNGGARLEMHAPLPADEPLEVRASLVDIDDNGRRAVLHQRVVSGTRSAPEALTAHVYGVIPLGGSKSKDKDDASKRAKERVRVPVDARELDRWKLPLNEGLAFALLTGDFNPVHWVTPYAKAFGFKNRILHGFATMARAYEGIVRKALAGETAKLSTFDVKFTRPLVLPARVGLYAKDGGLWVGDAPGAPAYLAGTYQTRP